MAPNMSTPLSDRLPLDIPTPDKGPVVFDEIATRARMDLVFGSLYFMLANPDPLLRRSGYAIAIYDDVKRDPQVNSCIGQRVAGTIARQWRLDQNDASESTTATLQDILLELPMLEIWRQMLDGACYGYQPLEIVWSIIDGYIVPGKIEAKPVEWFWFDQANNFMRREHLQLWGVPCEDRKFLLVRRNPSYKNPYGEGLLSMCFWPTTFKRGGLKFWATFLERYGMAHAVANVPDTIEPAKRQEVLSALKGMVRDAIAVFPNGTDIKLLESAGKTSSSDAYATYAQYHDAEISKVILGHGSAADATPGKLGGQQDAMNVREDLVNSDCGLIEECVNRQLIPWMQQLNPSLAGPAPKFTIYQKEQVDKTLAERDQIVSSNGKIAFTKQYYMRAYGYGDSDIVVNEQPNAPASIVPSGGPQFSSPTALPDVDAAQRAIDALMAAVPGSQLQAHMSATLKPIFDLQEQCTTLAEFRRRLADLYPSMDTTATEKLLAGAGLLAQVWGRANAQEAQ